MAIKASWIGLGVMGFPMAGHLSASADVKLTVYNRSAEKADKWTQKYEGKVAATPSDAAADSDFVFACVGNDDDLRSVTLGPEGAFQKMRAGSIFVDHTTASADVARELFDEAKKRGIGFIDAPVSGGQAGAENGALTVMCGGEEGAYAKAEPLIKRYSKMRKLLGPAGSGQTAKMCNQIAIAGLVQGLAPDGISRGSPDSRSTEPSSATFPSAGCTTWTPSIARPGDSRGEFGRSEPPRAHPPALSRRVSRSADSSPGSSDTTRGFLELSGDAETG